MAASELGTGRKFELLGVRGVVKDDSKGNVGMTAALASVGLANGSS